MGRSFVRLLAWQIVLTGAVVLIAGLGWGTQAALAGMLGGAAAAAAAAAYVAAWWLQSRSQTSRPMRVFLVAESCRLGTALGLLAYGMRSLPPEAAVVFLAGFAAALMAYLVGLLSS